MNHCYIRSWFVISVIIYFITFSQDGGQLTERLDKRSLVKSKSTVVIIFVVQQKCAIVIILDNSVYTNFIKFM